MTPGALLITTLYFLFLNGINHVLSQDCSNATVQACLKPLRDVAYELDQAIVPTMNEAQLDDHCRRYDLFAECMEQVKPYCNVLERQSYEGIDDAYDYLCDTHKKEYLRHRDCFRDKNLHREGAHCNNTLESKLDQLGFYSRPEYKRDRICQYAEDYFDCVENAVSSFCGKEAAAWQRGMDELSLGPLLTAIGCPGYGQTDYIPGSSRSWLMILIGIVVALAVIIIATSVIMLFLIRRKKKMTREATQRHGDPELPPPYTGPVAYGAGSQSVDMSNGQAGALPEKGPGLLPPPYSGAELDGGHDNKAFMDPSLMASGTAEDPSPSAPPLHRERTGPDQPQLYDSVNHNPAR